MFSLGCPEVIVFRLGLVAIYGQRVGRTLRKRFVDIKYLVSDVFYKAIRGCFKPLFFCDNR